jgi:protein-disulfide isomerase
MKNASWIIALVVGAVAGVAVDRMVVGGPRRPAAVAAAPRAAAPQAPPVEDPRAIYKVPLDDSPVRGAADALVTIVVASDFQCPFCKRVEPSVQALQDAFPGKVRVAWKHFPLPGHPKAIPAAVVAEEARAQGGDAKFWAVHDRLFASAPALDRPDLERVARDAGVDVAAVGTALDQGKHMDRIRRDQAQCQALGVNSTPTLFINGRKVVGALPVEQLKPVVEEELKKAEALVASGVAAKDVYAKAIERGATSTVFLAGGTPRPQPAAAPQPPPPQAAKIPLRADDPVRGPAQAKVTVALFSDFQCPFCSRVEPTLRQLEEAYPGQIRIVWKHQPLPFHPNALPAARAAEAAREQGKFWPMHDRLFSNQAGLSEATYTQYAKELGLDLARFERDAKGEAGKKRIEEDQALGNKVGANGTPTMFVNCKMLVGALPLDMMKPLVEEQLKKADSLLAQGAKLDGAFYERICTENVSAQAAAPAPAPGGGAQPAVPTMKADAVPLRKDDPVKGKGDARVTMVLFSDFQCPYCARAEPAVKDVEQAYPNDVKVVWKHFPLPFHPNAMPAALAAEAAREQGGSAKFWAMHDKLFANQQALSEATYEQYARELGLDLARFKADLASPKLRARVEEDAKLAQQLQVNGTPTFLVNGERVVGANGLRQAVERQIAMARK